MTDTTGTKLEKQKRLIEIAQEMGFADAEGAWWDHENPEQSLQAWPEVTESAGLDDPQEVTLGIFLGAEITVVAHEGADGFMETKAYETRIDADAAIAARQTPEAGA